MPLRCLAAAALLIAPAFCQLPAKTGTGFDLPNGWKITPVGKSVVAPDMVLKVITAPDGKSVVASHGGFNPHGLVVVKTDAHDVAQNIPLASTWLGMTWSPDGGTLYVSGGNANGRRSSKAPVYEFRYRDGRLDPTPAAQLDDPSVSNSQVFWAGLAYHPKKDRLYAVHRGANPSLGRVVVFDAKTRAVITRIPVDVSPYEAVFGPEGRYLYVSNWSSASISVIDTDRDKVVGTIAVGLNPNDLQIGADGRLYVACSNENSVYVIDTAKRSVEERISTTLYPRAPEGSTPNALALDQKTNRLYIANADNNAIAVVNVAERGRSRVVGFIPTSWYPSALTLAAGGSKLYVGTSKGAGSYPDVYGPGSPLVDEQHKTASIKNLQRGSVDVIEVGDLATKLAAYTKQVMDNSPYNDTLLTQAKAPAVESIVPREVGAGSPIEHVLYIIKENRTYDQVFGDVAKGNGDARLAIFGRKVTPNHHALADQFVLLDNLYCDGEVSVDGHSWSNSAYATDFNEKLWPLSYGGNGSGGKNTAGYIPSAGHIWDLARRKGLTYRSYGEYASRSSDGTTMEAAEGVDGLWGHVSKEYKNDTRDPIKTAVFLKEFDEYEKNFDQADPTKRLPNFMVMSLGEDHTVGTRPGLPTPVAAVASNDQAVGMIVERLSHSKYWPKTAIFVIEDDAQDGADHVDAHRTVGLLISPYSRKAALDSTLYTTSSMVRTIELLLGLPPMSQYDAAATPMYRSMGTTPDLAAYTLLPPEVDVNAKNGPNAYGAALSKQMDFSEPDQAPMLALNEIIWKSVRGANSPMPAPVHRYRPLVDGSQASLSK